MVNLMELKKYDYSSEDYEHYLHFGWWSDLRDKVVKPVVSTVANIVVPGSGSVVDSVLNPPKGGSSGGSSSGGSAGSRTATHSPQANNLWVDGTGTATDNKKWYIIGGIGVVGVLLLVMFMNSKNRRRY